MGKRIRVNISLIVIVILFGLIVYAVPQMPTGYDGTVLIDGITPPVGTSVYVKDVNSMVVGNDSTGTDSSGDFDINVGRESVANAGNITDIFVTDDETIIFYVAGITSNTTTVGAIGAVISNFDLSVSDTTAPSSPSSVVATELNLSNQSIVNISWTTSTDNIWTNLSYLVFRSTSSGVSASDTYIGTTYYNGAGNTYINDTLPSTGLSYYYTVYANDTSGNLGSAATEDSVVVSNLVPSQVLGLSAFTSNKTVNLTWNAVSTHNNTAPIGSDLAGYKVFSNYSGIWTLVYTTTESSYINNSLINGESYCYQIAAYDLDSNEGENSTEVCASPSERPSITIVPATNSIIQSSVQINVSILSGQTLDAVNYYVYNSTFANIQNQSNTSVSVLSWDYTIIPSLWLENIWHNLIVRANDTSGQNNSLSYNFMIDDTNPVVTDTISDDLDDKAKSTDVLNITANVTDANTITSVILNGTSMTQSGDIWSLSATAAYFGCSGLQDCILTYIATDIAGNINNTNTYTIEVDDVNPAVFDSNTNDSDNKVRDTDSLNITVNVTDSNTITSVLVNGTSMIKQGLTNQWSTVNSTADFGCTGDTTCVLTFVATDIVGNINNSHTLTLTVDDVAPVVLGSNTNDTDNIVKSTDSLNITVNVSDTNSIMGVSLNGTNLIQGSNNIWSTINSTADFGCSGDTTCVLTFIATDELGNINNSHTLNIVVDDINPIVFNGNTDDLDNIVKSTDSLNITVNATDSNFGSVFINGTSMTQLGDIWTTINTTSQFCPSVTNGVCTLTFIATDLAGNINNSHNLILTVDDVNPFVFASNTNDSDNIVLSTDSLNITVNVTDLNTITSVLVNGTSMVEGVSGLWSIVNSTADFGCTGDTTCVLTFVATDIVGNINSSQTLTITVDDVAPSVATPSVSDLYIHNNTEIFVNASVTETNAFSSFNVSTTGGPSLELSLISGTTYGRFINATAIGCGAEGACLLKFTAVDIVGNSHTRTQQVIVDHTVPTINSVSISNNYVRNNTAVNITVNATDLWSVPVFSVYAEGINLTRQSTDIFIGTINLTDSDLIVSVSATDDADNVGNDTSTTFIIDNDNPSINLVILSDSYIMPGQTVEVVVNVTDSYTTSVTANGNALLNLTTANDLWAANITMPQSSGKLVIVATDFVENTNTTNSSGFIVDSMAPIFSYTMPQANGIYANTDGNITFNFSVSDQNLTKVNVSVDSGLYTNGSTLNGTNIWVFNGLGAGLHTAVFTAQDEAGWNTTESFNFTIYRPVNLTKYHEDLTSELGNDVLRVNFTANSSDLNNNDSAEINQTLSLDIGLNVSGINVTARIPGFAGLKARWEHKFSVETNHSSTKGNTASSRSGSTIQKIVLFENASNFLAEADFGMATITFDTVLGNLDVFFIEDNQGNTLYKLSKCLSVPSSVATSLEACYLNTSTNVTLYLPHFSGGALANDSIAPAITITSPLNDSLLSNSVFDLNLTIYEANPHETNFCNYTLYSGSTLESADTAILSTEMTNDGSTMYTYSVKVQNISDGVFNLTVNCMDLNNQSSTLLYNFTVIDTTSPVISSYTPTTDVTTTATSVDVTISSTTSEYTICKFSITNGTYASMSSYLGSETVYGLSHSTESTYTSDDSSEIYYVICQDLSGQNSSVQTISYSVNVGSGDSGDSPSSSTTTRSGEDSAAEESTKTTLIMSFGNLVTGDLINFEPNSINIPIKKLSFKAGSEISFMTMIVSSFDSKPSNLTELLNAYKYLELKGTGFNAAHVEGGLIEITFVVSSEWVKENSNKDTVFLYRYNNGWEKLKTEFIKEENAFYYYKSYTPGFSYFAIVTKEKEIEKVEDISDKIDIDDSDIDVIDVPTKNTDPIDKQIVKKSRWPMLIATLALIGAAVLLFYHPKRKQPKKELSLSEIKEKLNDKKIKQEDNNKDTELKEIKKELEKQ